MEEIDITDMNLSQLWKYAMAKELEKEYREETLRAREGLSIKVPIYYLTEGWYETYPSTGRAKVIGFGKFPLKELMEEIEKREALLRKIIMEYEKGEDPIEPR